MRDFNSMNFAEFELKTFGTTMTTDNGPISARVNPRMAVSTSTPAIRQVRAQKHAVLEEVKHLARMGASVILLKPKTKQPVEAGWSEKPRYSYAQLEAQYEDDMNLGVRLGIHSKIDGMFLHAIDVDIRDPKEKDAAFAELNRLLPGVNLQNLPRVRSGSGGESCHLYFVTDVAYRGKSLAKSGRQIIGEDGKPHQSWEIDLFGTGKQVALPPSIHPISQKPYCWEVEIDPTNEIPYISDKTIEGLVNPVRYEGPVKTGVIEISYEEVEERFEYLDLDPWCVHRPYWLRLGMALHHNFNGEKAAFELWCKFSKKIPEKFDRAEAWKDWKSFDRGNPQRPFTLRTILKESNSAMRHAELMADIDAMENLVDPDAPKPYTRVEQRALKDEFENLVELADKKSDLRARKPYPDDPDISILQQVRNPAPDFPLHVVPPFWQQEIETLATNGAAPIDYAAAGVFSIAASLIGNSRWVSPLPEWREPTVMWCQIIGPPSANKSPALRPLIKTVSDIEAGWEPDYHEAKRLWQSNKKQADMKRKQWENRMAAALEKGEDIGDMPPDCIAPPEPVRRRALVGDSTLEALVRLMTDNPRGFLNYRDEMTGWSQNLSRYGGPGATDRPAWLEAFGGGVYTVDRVKDGGEPVRVRNFNVSILGGIQPEPLLALVSSAEDGLQARFMPFWPENAIRKINRGKRAELRSRLPFETLSELRMRKDKATGLWEPVIVPFSNGAMDVFEEWSNDRKVREKYAPTKLQGPFGKADAHVARMALVLEFLDWCTDPFNENVNGPQEVSTGSVRKAIEFRESYLKPMQMRVFGLAATSDEVRMAKVIAEWIIDSGREHFTATFVQREAGITGISRRTDKDQLQDALAYLESLRWLRREETTTAKGGRPTKRYFVNDRLWALVGK